jgi:5-methylthioadenosine/S-adenosylhomocysteine deaminase
MAGLRALLGRSTMDSGSGLPEAMRETTAACMEAEDELAERWHGPAKGRIRMSCTLRTIFNCSDDLIVLRADRAKCLGTVVQMNVAEVPDEVDYVTASRDTAVIRHLDNIGVLGPRFRAIHAVWLDEGRWTCSQPWPRWAQRRP